MEIKLKGNEQVTVTVNPENPLVGTPEWTVVTGTSAVVVPEADSKKARIAAVLDECGLTIIRLKAVCNNPAHVAAKAEVEKLEKAEKAKKAETKTEAKVEKPKAWETKTEKAEKTEAKADTKDVLPPETLIYVTEFFVAVTNLNPTTALRIGITEPIEIPETLTPQVGTTEPKLHSDQPEVRHK